jgi:cysteine-rich repeat protein
MLRKQLSAFLDLLVALLVLAFGTVVDIALALGSALQSVFFSGAGLFLLGSIVLGALGALITEFHPDLFAVLDKVYCEIFQFRLDIFNFFDVITPVGELILCISNLILGFNSLLFQNFVRIGLDCSDGENWKDVLLQLGSFLLAIFESLFNWIANPFENFIVLYSADPLIRTPWSTLQELLDLLVITADCQCSGLHDVVVYLFSILRDSNLGCAIDNTANVGIALFQATLKILLQQEFELVNNATGGVVSVLDPTFDRAQSALLCIGLWLDCTLQGIIGLLAGCPSFDSCLDNTCAPNLGLFVFLSRVATSIIEFLALFANFFLQAIAEGLLTGTVDIIELITNARLPDLVAQTHEMALAAGVVVSNFDSCLGQATAAFVDLLSITIEFLGRIVQQNQWDFSLIFNGVFAVFGDQTYDTLGNPSHVSCPVLPCPPSAIHNPHPQTGLVCFFARLIGNGACAKAFADLVSAVGQIFVIPVLLAEELFTLDYSALNFDGNPIAGTDRAKLEDTLNTILGVGSDRLIALVDYTGHFIACIPGLSSFGLAIQTLAGVLDFTVDSIKDLIISTLLLVAQAIIWFLSLVGASPFDGRDSGDEIATFFDTLVDWFLQIFDVILTLLTSFVDYVIFPWFPTLFGQGSLLGDNPGDAKFTECIAEFGDCLCGLTKRLASKICIGELGCLSSWWPDCGEFNPSRRRSSTLAGGWRNISKTDVELDADGNFIFPGNVFEFYALHFNNTVCGKIFEYWADNPPAEGENVDPHDAEQMLQCVNVIHASAHAGNYFNNSDVPSGFFASPSQIMNSLKDFGTGAALLGSLSWTNLLLYYSDPAELRDMPEANVTYYNFTEALGRHNVSDTIAVQAITSVQDGFSSSWSAIKALSKSTFSQRYPGQNLPGETVALGYALHDTLVSGAIATMSIVREFRRQNVISKFSTGITDAVSHGYGVITDVHERRRGVYAQHYSSSQLIEPVFQPLAPEDDPMWRAAHNLWPTRITTSMWRRGKAKQIYTAFAEMGKHMVGLETLMPLRNESGGIIETQTTIPNSCASILTLCTVDYNTCQNGNSSLGCIQPNVTCSGDTQYIPTHAICNEFFGNAVVAGLCDANIGQIIAIYVPFQNCLLAAQDIPVTSPIIIVAGVSGFTCFDTQSVELGSICLSANGCAICPTEQVFPGFDCPLLDNTISDTEWLARRCVDKLGLGPPQPVLPTNITAWFYEAINIQPSFIVNRSTCGNGVVETNYTITYTNPFTRVVRMFNGEQCDPPYSTGFFVNANGTNVSYICGASCQYAVCGNGVVDPGEACDDGDNDDSNSCSSSCRPVICGNGIIDGNEGCDDGNRISGDGCSHYCEREICPSFTFIYEDITDLPGQFYSQTYCPGALNGATRFDSTRSRFCWNSANPEGGATQISVSIDCLARVPVLEVYGGVDCSLTQPELVEILNNCSSQRPVCGSALFGDFGACDVGLQVGLDFTCTRLCPICGDNITNTMAEQCDDGSIHLTGDPIEDQCVRCRTTCTCHPDPRVPCSGFCEFSSSASCNVRDPSACAGLSQCIPTECCGDGILQVSEQCDDNPNPLNASDPSNCLTCIQQQCACQPGRPCLGRCLLDGVPQSYPQAFQDTIDNQLYDQPLYCDVLREPFACYLPVLGGTIAENEAAYRRSQRMICAPVSCCGDGIEQDAESDSAFSNGLMCEPGFTSTFGDPCPSDCRYIDNSTGLQRLPNDEGLLPYSTAGRLHRCGIAPFGNSQGTRSYPPIEDCLPELFDPCDPYPSFNVSAVIGQCYDTITGGYTSPQQICNPDELDSCTKLGYPNSICGNYVCCGDLRYGPDAGSPVPAHFEDNSDALGCESFAPACSGLGDDATCEFGKFLYSIDACVCQPNATCMGRCTDRSRPTDMLCDAATPSNSPWCSGPDLECVPIACCNDGVKITAHGYEGIFTLDGFPEWKDWPNTRLTALEDCDPSTLSNPECDYINATFTYGLTTTPLFAYFEGTWSDCKLAPQTLPRRFTQSPPRTPGNYIDCIGYCTDMSTGMASGQCLNKNGDADCPLGLQCLASACCGNGLLEFPEMFECDNTTDDRCTTLNANEPQGSLCGLYEIIYLGGKRKRDIHSGFITLEENSPIYRAYLAELNVSLNLTVFDDAEAAAAIERFESILEFFGESTSSLEDRYNTVIEWFERPSTDLYAAPEERGFRFWAKFEVSCKQPIHGDCTRGVGTLKAVKDVGFWLLVLVVLTGFSSLWLGQVPLMVLLGLIGLFGGMLFAAYAYHYPFPRCLFSGVVPECLFAEVRDILQWTAYRCLHWPHGFLLGVAIDEPFTNVTCPQECGRPFIDCKSLGFVNGWDTLNFGLKKLAPDQLATFETTFFYTLLVQLLPGLQSAADRNFPSCADCNEGCADELACVQLENCWKLTFANLFQLVAAVTLAVLITLTLLSAIIKAIERAARAVSACGRAVSAFMEDEEYEAGITTWS